MIKFSAIIPTFNRAKYIQLAVQSALSQKREDIEIIVIDDGSTDDTAKVLKGGNPVVKYIYQDNQGVGSARNRGIRAARGEWIAFLDSDDEWQPGYLAKQTELIGRHPSAVCGMLNAEDVSSPKNLANYFEVNGMTKIFGPGPEALVDAPFELAARHDLSILNSSVFRRDILLTTQLFDETLSIGEDLDVVLQMALKGPFVFCRDVGTLIYRREESILNLSAQLNRTGLKSRLCWNRVFERFYQGARLSERERKALGIKYSCSQRALGNLYMRMSDMARAREAYKQAWVIRPSIESAAKLGFAYLPFGFGKLFLRKGENARLGAA